MVLQTQGICHYVQISILFIPPLELFFLVFAFVYGNVILCFSPQDLFLFCGYKCLPVGR